MSESVARYYVNTDAGMSSELRRNITSMKKRVADVSLSYEPPSIDSIKLLMQRCGWRQSFVANLVNVNVSTVRRWMSEPNPEGYSKIPFGEWFLLLVLADEISTKDVGAPICDDTYHTYINDNKK